MIYPQTYEQLKTDFPMCRNTFLKYIQEIREEIQIGRYDPCVLIDETPVRVSPLAFIDYLSHRKELRSKNARKSVPDFDPESIKKNYPVSLEVGEVAEKVLEKMGYHD